MKPILHPLLVSLFLLSGAIPGAEILANGRKKSNLKFENTIRIDSLDSKEEIVRKAAHVVPLKRQLDALDREFIAFIHFGPNTFTGKEWGNGLEAADAFAPTGLDTDKMVRSLKDAGMKMVILTVKHHDGYVLWQSRYTDHGVMKSDWLGGQGDVLKDLAASCEKYGMKLGIYLSPADLYQIESPEGLYGNLSSKTPAPSLVRWRGVRLKTKPLSSLRSMTIMSIFLISFSNCSPNTGRLTKCGLTAPILSERVGRPTTTMPGRN